MSLTNVAHSQTHFKVVVVPRVFTQLWAYFERRHNSDMVRPSFTWDASDSHSVIMSPDYLP